MRRFFSHRVFDISVALLVGLIAASVYAQGPAPDPYARGGVAHPQLVQLEGDATQLYGDQDRLVKRIGRDGTALGVAAKALGLLITTDAGLAALDQESGEIEKMAQALAEVPEEGIREASNRSLQVIRPMRQQIHDAHMRLQRIAKAIEPVREKLKSLSDGAQLLKADLTRINNLYVFNLVPLAKAADNCLAFVVPPPVLECSVSHTSDVAAKADVAVREYDRVVRLLLSSPDLLPDMELMLAPLIVEVGALEALARDVDRLQHQLETFSRDLKDVMDLLNRSFCFRFPIPGGHHGVCIGFRTILNGSEAIEREIEHVLSKTLWHVLKDLGVKHYIHDLEDDAKKALNGVLSAVARDVNIPVPDFSVLGRVEVAVANLASKLPNINYPTVNMNLPSFGLPNVNVGIDLRWLLQFLTTFNGVTVACSPLWAGCSTTR